MGKSSTSPPTAIATHRKSMARRDCTRATVSGPMNSIATATPRGMVRKAR